MKEDRVFIDTNVLVYAFDSSELLKQETSRALINRLSSLGCDICISAQVVNEFTRIVTEKIRMPLPLKKLDSYYDLFEQIFNVIPLSMESSRQALTVREKYGFSFWDSLIVSTALAANCQSLYSEDLQHGQILEGRLKILNPFRESLVN